MFKRPNDQKVIEYFFNFTQTKTKEKIDINNQKSLDIIEDNLKEYKDIPQFQINPANNINKSIINNKEILPQQGYKNLVDEEIIFPIMIDSTLVVNNDLLSSQIEEILKKVNTNSNWVEVFPLIYTENINLKIKDPENKSNCIILGYITKHLSEKLSILFQNEIIWIKIFLNKNGRRLAILIGLNYNRYNLKVDFIDGKNNLYKLKLAGDLALGDKIYNIIKEIRNKYNPQENFKNDFLYLINNITIKNIENINLNEINEERHIDNKTGANFKENKNKEDNNLFINYIVDNFEKILSLTLNYNNLFNKDEKNYYNKFIDLNSEAKIILLQFLKGKDKWQNKNVLFSNDNYILNNENIKENFDKALETLLEKKFISNLYDIVGDFNTLDNDKLFEFLYYLSLDDLQNIKSDLEKLYKNPQKIIINKESKKRLLNSYIKECFINNPFYNLDSFFPPNYKKGLIDFNKIIKNISEKITEFNYTENKTKSKKGVFYQQNLLYSNKTDIDNSEYITVKINESNYKYMKFIEKNKDNNKMNLINDIINSINLYLEIKTNSLIEDHLIKNNSKEKNLQNIFENYNKIYFCIHRNLTRIIDTSIRLFFFYDDFQYINNMKNTFCKNEKYEDYKFSKLKAKNKIFKELNVFNLYDILYQIKDSYLIICNQNKFIKEKYPHFLFEILNPFVNFLLQNINNSLYKNILTKIFNIYSLQYDKNDILNDKLIHNLTTIFESSSELHNVDNIITFENKYKPEYISAEILYYIAINLEKIDINNENSNNRNINKYKNKDSKKANLIYLFLLNCFDNLFVFEKRGLIYHNIIKNFKKYLKNYKPIVEILNICVKYEIMKYKIIKKEDLLLLKNDYDFLIKQNNNSKNKENAEILNSLNPFPFEELNDNNFIKSITKEINDVTRKNILISKKHFKGRKIDEENALNYYLKNESLKGISGAKYIIPSIYFLFLWEEIFDNEIPLVFQSKYQAYPLDFFEKDFYLNRKVKLDKKLEIIKSYKKEELINHLKNTYETKKGTKNPFLDWNNQIYNKDLLIKIILAFGAKNLVETFKTILNHGLKNIKNGMPDLLLWKENEINIEKDSLNNVESNSIKLVTIKTIRGDLNEEKKFWLKFFHQNNISVEVLFFK